MDDGTDEKYYEQMNWTIIDGNVMNMSLVEGCYGNIDSDDSTCHGYYIIIFYSSPYTLKADLSIDGQVISSGEMVCEVIYFSQSISIIIIMFYKRINPITQLFF